ncbi:hypothetical protein GCM10027418_12040 [Mariniluteicoccus endophyticus]
MSTSISRRSLLLGSAGAATLGAASLAGLDVARASSRFGLEPIPGVPQVNGRLVYWRFRTANIGWNPGVNVLLPSSYSSGKRYPVLYLLHGGGGDFIQWHRSGVIEATANADVIVVMPDGGKAGWYCNPVRSTVGPRNWESFHMAQLVPWVDATYRTHAEYAGRAIAGFSMGGFGALKYTAKYYGHFSSVTSFSGPASLRRDFGFLTHYINSTGAVDNGVVGGIYGAPWDERRVTMDNPMENIERYRHKRVSLYCGSANDPQENQVRAGQYEFAAALSRAGIAHSHVVHPGGHGANLIINFKADLPGILGHLRRAA